jgi:endo-1,4-beta-xylanase
MPVYSSFSGNRRGIAVARIVVALLIGSSLLARPAAGQEMRSLKAEFGGDFLVGAALDYEQILGRDQASPEFIARQFSALTAENAMKWERIHPTEEQYVWTYADALTAFARQHGIHVTGHTLVWHRQTPDWVFEDDAGAPASRQLLLSRLESHITTVVGRYRGLVQSWDVVNEAINNDGTPRDSRWRRIIGDDYIAKAFEFAHAADPDALLNYNDFDMYLPAKRAAVIRLVEDLRGAGLPVFGVGMQAHYRLDAPADLGDVEDSIIAFAAAGVAVMITELDVSVLPWPSEAQGAVSIGGRFRHDARFDPYVGGLPADVEQAFNRRYVELFRIFLAHSDEIARVTFWGVHDAQSWKNNWPMRGRTDYPLLFDRNNAPKPALGDVLALKHRVRDESDTLAVR